MPLAAGSRIGAYEVVAAIGAGGMGEVYRGRDTKLHRDVAIKILPELFASDPERRARFDREAQLLASLNHPHIAQIYGVEESAGMPALVMELVDGPTLAEVLERLSASRTGESYRTRRDDIDPLDIARQIAEALEAAHERGIIHRDLKPQNIKLAPDGTVKVLDFGLGKALDPIADTPAHSPTVTNLDTRVGTLLGTAAYMAPEQVKGRAADRRADIWAFGVVLYELLTGAAPFKGDGTSEILARVIERDPDWSKIPADTPPSIVRLLERALVKDPKRRLQSIGDARLEIEEALAGPATRSAAGGPVAARYTRWWLIPLAAAALLGIGVLAGRMIGAPPQTPDAPPIRASIALPEGLYLDGAGPPELALSRDGRTLAFVARAQSGAQRLYVRPLDSDSATLVPDSETVEGPFFSPDGGWIAFAVGVSVLGGVPPELRKYSLDTGLTQTIARVDDYFGGVWLDEGSILYVDRQPAGLWKVDAGGGTPQQIAARFVVDGQEVERAIAWPALLPDGRSVLVSDWEGSSIGHLTVIDLESRRATRLGIEGSGGRFLPNGYLVYASRTAALLAAPFDRTRMRPSGTAAAIMPDIAFGRNNMPVFAVSENGTLVYATGYLRGSRREPMRLVRHPLSGAPVPLAFEPDLLYRGFSLSSDGRQLAVGAWDGSLWIYDLRRGTRMKHPVQVVGEVSSLSWSPDGRRLAVAGTAAGRSSWALVVESLDQPGRHEVRAELPDSEIHVAGWTPDGKTIFGWGSIVESRSPIYRFDEGQPVKTIGVEPGFLSGMAVSPDGRWLAHVSSAPGSLEVFVMPATGTGSRVAVTSRGGSNPRWSRDGRQLFFRRDGGLLAVDVEATADGIHLGAERVASNEDVGRDYDVAPTGEFYSMQPVPGAGDQTSIQLRTGWFEEVERLMRRRTP